MFEWVAEQVMFANLFRAGAPVTSPREHPGAIVRPRVVAGTPSLPLVMDLVIAQASAGAPAPFEPIEEYRREHSAVPFEAWERPVRLAALLPSRAGFPPALFAGESSQLQLGDGSIPRRV